MTNHTTIRKYQQNDLAGLMAAWEGANSLAHPFLNEEYVAQVRQDIPALYIPNADTWVAEHDNKVVGFISLIGNEVGAIFLLPKHHGTGIGAALMNKAEQLHDCLEVEVFRANVIGLEFYKQYGFEMMCQELHQQTGQQVLRLKYVANTPQYNKH